MVLLQMFPLVEVWMLVHQRLHGKVTEAVHHQGRLIGGLGAVHQLGQLGRLLKRPLDARPPAQRTAGHRHRPREQTLGQRGEEVIVDTGPARLLTHDGHSVRVPGERGDVLLDPPEQG